MKPLPIDLLRFPTTWLVVQGFRYREGQCPSETIPGHILSEHPNSQLRQRVTETALHVWSEGLTMVGLFSERRRWRMQLTAEGDA